MKRNPIGLSVILFRPCVFVWESPRNRHKATSGILCEHQPFISSVLLTWFVGVGPDPGHTAQLVKHPAHGLLPQKEKKRVKYDGTKPLGKFFSISSHRPG